MNYLLKSFFKKKYRQLLLLQIFLLSVLISSAQQPVAKAESPLSNPGVFMSLIVIASLGIVIIILGNAVVAARGIYEERVKKEKEQSSTSTLKTIALIAAGTLTVQSTMAQTAEAVNEKSSFLPSSIGGMPAATFYLLIIIIIVELIVILVLVNILKFLTGIKSKPFFKSKPAGIPARESSLTAWWNKLNKSVAIEKEKDIDLSHDYDGIRELDNAVPPWWQWTFIATILFGVIYLWRFHISETAPLQIEELRIAMQKADIDKEAYLKIAANKVDENSVKMLDENGIAAGKTLFAANCIACHGANGEGNAVGPNLTDAYWLHKGGINDIFKTIKYGWVEKGMKAWKDDFTPTQIAQLASYVKAINNTNPPNARAPQGELYKEEAKAVVDSAKAATAAPDSVAVKLK